MSKKTKSVAKNAGTAAIVAIKINQDRLLANLQHSFSNQHTLVGELMQNARRAGATNVIFNYIEEGKLFVCDNGKGIDDFQHLFSVAESGWDAETVRVEKAFGMGWLSCLYGAEHIYVESNGRYIEGNTSDILAGASLEVKSCKRGVESSYTQVILTGFKLESKDVVDVLHKLSHGFAIPVYLNGEQMSRNFALETAEDGDFLSVADIGHIKVRHHIDLERHTRHYNLIGDIVVYLQGLPVYDNRNHHRIATADIVHLDSTLFVARMPDRDKLVDEAEVLKRIKAAIHRIHLDRLLAMKANLTPEEFASQGIAEYAMQIEGGFDVLCDKGVRLSNTFYGHVDEQQPTCWNDASAIKHTSEQLSVSFEDVQSGSAMLFNTEDMNEYEDESNAAAWIFARNMGWNMVDFHQFTLKGEFQRKHWSTPFVHVLSNDNLSVEIIGKGKEGKIGLSYWQSWCNVVLCESYRITYTAPDGREFSCDVDDEPLLTKDNLLLVPAKAVEPGDMTVGQGSSYNDDGDFNEGEYEEDARALNHYINMLRTGDETKSLQALLNSVSLSDYKDFIGQKYELTLDQHCNIVLTKMPVNLAA